LKLIFFQYMNSRGFEFLSWSELCCVYSTVWISPRF